MLLPPRVIHEKQMEQPAAIVPANKSKNFAEQNRAIHLSLVGGGADVVQIELFKFNNHWQTCNR